MTAISQLQSTLTADGFGNDAGSVSRDLRDWIGALAPAESVTVAGSAADSEVTGIAIRLVAVAPRVVPLSPGRKSAVLALDYLVTIRLGDALAEHALLSEIAFAVADAAEFDLVSDTSIANLCSSLGLQGSTGLILRTELRRDAVLPRAPLVRHPAVHTLEPLAQARGRVVGPDGHPVSGALVSVDGTSRCCTTGPDGRFRFSIPADHPATVTVRARSFEVSASLAPETETILTLQMET